MENFPWVLSETEPPTKEHTQAVPGSLHICSRCAAQSSSGSSDNWIGDCPKSCCLSLEYVPLTGLPCLASVGEDVSSPVET